MERVYEELLVPVLRRVQGVESVSRWYRVSEIDIQGPASPQAVLLLLLGTEISSRRWCILVGLVSACLENGPQRDCLGISRICQALEGVVWYTVPQTGQLKILNLHTRIWNTLYPDYASERFACKLVSGMYIDTSVRPFAWKIILRDTDMECTRIYDSSTNKWSEKGSGLHASYERAYQKGLAWSKDVVCIQYSHILLTYDLPEDVWTALSMCPI